MNRQQLKRRDMFTVKESYSVLYLFTYRGIHRKRTFNWKSCFTLKAHRRDFREKKSIKSHAVNGSLGKLNWKETTLAIERQREAIVLINEKSGQRRLVLRQATTRRDNFSSSNLFFVDQAQQKILHVNKILSFNQHSSSELRSKQFNWRNVQDSEAACKAACLAGLLKWKIQFHID